MPQLGIKLLDFTYESFKSNPTIPTNKNIASLFIPKEVLSSSISITGNDVNKNQSEMLKYPIISNLSNDQEYEKLSNEIKSMVKGILLKINTQDPVQLRTSFASLQLIKKKGLIAQAILKLDLTADIIEEAGVVAFIADSGTDSIIIDTNTSSTNNIQSDDLFQHFIEECFGLDVDGEAISERLAIKGNLSICDQAIKLGVTQLCISDTPSVPIGKYLTYEEATLLIQESGKKLLS
jgi:hypothetical protein